MNGFNNELEENLRNIDNIIINACLAIIAAFVILFTIDKGNTPEVILSVVSVSFFSITLLLTLWHKYRSMFRSTLYKKKHEDWLRESKAVIGEMVEQVEATAKLEAENYIREHKDELIGKPKEQIQEILKNQAQKEKFSKRYEQTISNVSYALSTKAKLNYELSFDRPLDERLAKIKYIIDYLARHSRYYLFTLGLVTFVIALVVKS